jgi:hypothetical protein
MTGLNFRLTNRKNSFKSGSFTSYLHDLVPSGDWGIGLSFSTLSEKGSSYKSILYLYQPIMTGPIARSTSSFIKQLHNLAPKGDRGIGLSFMTQSEKMSSYISVL